MSRVIALGYLGLSSSDMDAWPDYGSHVLGLQPTQTPGGLLAFRMDARAWRIAVMPGPGGPSFFGWEVADAAALQEVAESLQANGIKALYDSDLATARGVRGLLACRDTGGNALEFFYGPHEASDEFVSPRSTEFVTTSVSPGDLGLGHVVLTFDDYPAARHFYSEILGFRLTDSVQGIPFFHVNRRHHSIAIGPVRPGTAPRLAHFMLEVADLDMVGRAMDAMAERQHPLSQTLGKHVNDWMVSFYARTPSDVEVEYGFGARQVDEADWETADYDLGDLWGHHRLPPVQWSESRAT